MTLRLGLRVTVLMHDQRRELFSLVFNMGRPKPALGMRLMVSRLLFVELFFETGEKRLTKQPLL